jgi:hypothetical protein
MNSTKEEASMRTKIFLMVAGVVAIGLPISAATIPVTTTNPAVAADGQCSLIEAIDNANADAAAHADCPAGIGADTIELASSAVYELDQVHINHLGPNGLPIIGSAITIQGHGSTIRRAAGAPDLRILALNSSGILRLYDLTLRSGDPGTGNVGGAVVNDAGVVELVRAQVTENTAHSGGGLYNGSGVMTLTDSEVSLNVAQGGGGGITSQAVTASAALVLDQTLVTGNDVVDGGGGGIWADANGSYTSDLDVIRSTIVNNTAGRTTGGIRSTSARVNIDDSTIDGNTADWACGGLYLENGAGDIDGTTISNNTVINTIDYGSGGGICVQDNTTTITNSTISGNTVLGPSTGQLYSGRGGGLSVLGGSSTVDTLVVVEDSTITDNTTELYGGGISVYRSAGTMAATVELRNTIVADNHEGGGAVLGNCVEESPATVSSLDFNLADDATCNLIGTDDLVVADVMLAPLAENGGPTMTHLPETGSPAVDSGDDALCPAVDQRGYVRPWDGDGNGSVHCDRGAVEHGAPYFHDGFETGTMSGWSLTVP